LSNAIVEKAEKNNISPLDVSEFKAISGKGIEAYIDNESVYAGNYSFASIYCEISKEATDVARSLANQGKTPLFFVKGGNLIGIIAVADTIKEDSREAIMELKSLNITPYMITGDNELTAKSIANESGIENVIAGVMPNEKSDKVRELKSGGNVAMVGDGINDAPALTSSDVGIAIGSGSDIAIDSADIVITKNTLMDVVTAIRLSRATLNTIKGNLFWAFIYNVIGISLATGMFIPLLGWELNPMFSALAMGLSSFFVVMNALRLNLFSKRGKK
jgi:Cu2+-exporting ATPase